MTFFEMFDAAKAGLANANVSGLNGHVAIQIEVTEDGCGIFYAEITDGVLNVQPYDYRDNTAAVTLPHSTLFALLRRETTLPEAVAQEKAFVQGCMESAAKLFAAVPAPKKAEAPKKEAAPAEEKKPACCKATATETKKETTCKAAATETKKETTCKAAATPVIEEKKEAATTPVKAAAPVVEEKKEAAATTAKAAAPVVEEKKEAATATTTTTTAPKTAAAKTVNRKATSKPMTKHNNRRK
ncbi:alkyl sulfatase C-terminal domain-containing protein [Ruminococcus sp.]|uniref:alkyl sulfatase C-terminal domain-containing protein n=1 Tax=Ruminococcus sp. TaxID=41978 RepID=UPI002EBE5600|nr:alkyl sulfatase C-terminal domain-containing protein [Ruminococcus sp.]